MIRDLRDFIEACRKSDELKEITAEVDGDLEVSHVAKLNEEKRGPALLFRNIKGYETPLFISALSTPRRLSLALSMKEENSICLMAREWVELKQKGHIPPRVVDTGPIVENVVEGDHINILAKFPVPRFYPMDGGRYFGTAGFLITQDPETGWMNLGTYRMQVLDRTHLGIQILKGKHADLMMNKYRQMGEKMPAAAVVGCDPVLFLLSSTTVGAGVSEYEVAGALRGEPIEVIKSDLTGLLLPATAEIVLEGEIDPNELREEGPFGEYTGYYSGSAKQEFKKPCMKVKRILHRNNPHFWATSVGKPVTDTHMLGSLQVSASLWSDLEEARVPGIEGVYCLPESTGRMWSVISVKQNYPGHAMHAATAAVGSSSGHYRMKGFIVVDDDIRADDISKVIWALGVRFDPARDTHVIRRTRPTPLDPSLPIKERTVGSKIIMDATIPYEWQEKPIEIQLDEETVKKVEKRWKEYGLD
jgi:phenylphosphate carboxylase beta subunit